MKRVGRVGCGCGYGCDCVGREAARGDGLGFEMKFWSVPWVLK